MAPVKVDPTKVREFKDAASFYTWLGKNHDKGGEVWIKIHKVNPGRPSSRDRCRAEGKGQAGKAHRAESLRARVPYPQHEDADRAQEEDRVFRRDAQARQDDLSATQEISGVCPGRRRRRNQM